MEGAGHNLAGRLSSMYEALGPSQATHTHRGRKEDDKSNTHNKEKDVLYL